MTHLRHDEYKGIADRYDIGHGQFDEHDPLVMDFFGRLFKNNRVRSVLDCACGTGQDLHLFGVLGCEAFGSDISESMLAHARKNLAARDINIPVRKVDYRELPENFGRQFDAVVCLSSSILHMPNEKEVSRAFRSMYQVLSDDGILVLTQGTTDRQWREKPRFILDVNNEDFTRLYVIDYLAEGARYNLVDIFHSEGCRALKVWSIAYAKVLLRDDFERTLTASGFRSVDFYGSYRFDKYDKETSRRLIAIAHK